MKKLGFGCMRLPLLDKSDQASFNTAQLEKMVDTFIERGFSYFDTALTYHDFKSEEAVCKSLTKRHPRDAFQLATKLAPRMLRAEEDQNRIFNEQLERCGVDYFDSYLVHNIGRSAYEQALRFRTFEFISRRKRAGEIKNAGMSFHDTPELLDEILTAHPELDFVQLQINYIDWENPGIQSRRCLEIAQKHKKPVIVMEPCKGGNLAQVPPEAEQLMKEYSPGASIPSWALRFAAGLEGVIMVLSGMSTLDQVLDNTTFMSDFRPLNDREHAIVRQVTDIINRNTAVPCTTCRYCEPECPNRIAIPDYFALYNSAKRAITDNMSSQFVYYLNLTSTHGRASACTACGRCERACPQHIEISRFMKDVSAAFDNTSLPSG